MNQIIIVLGSGINPDGSLPPVAMRRVEKAVSLYREKKHSNLVMSGKYAFWLDRLKQIPTHTEAEGMARYAETLGVPSEDIFMETDSKDTLGNAYFTKVNLLEPQEWNTVTVVTSEYHAMRTKYIFDLVLGPSYHITYVEADSGLAEDALQTLRNQEVITLRVLKEMHGTGVLPGDTEAIQHILFAKHPAYATNPEYSFERLREMLQLPPLTGAH